MSRPISSGPQELTSSNETVPGSVGSTSKCCWPSRGVVLPHWAVISMSAPVVGIVPPFRITAAEIATARSVRPPLGNNGLLRVNENFSPRATCTWSSHSPPLGPTGAAEQEGHLRSSVPHQCGDPSRSGPRSETPRRRDRLLQCVAYLEPATQSPSASPYHHSRWRPLTRSHPLGSFP